MRILYVIDTLKRGGKEKQFVELLKAIAVDNSVEVILFNKAIEYPEVLNLNITIHYFLSYKKSLKFLKFLIYRIKLLKPDILHSWDLVSSIMSGIAAKYTKTKHINGCIRGSVPLNNLPWQYFLYNISFFLSNAVISNSYAGLKAKKKLNNKKFKVIYNGFDINKEKRLNTAQIIKSLKIKTDKVVGMVANFRSGKDYYTFLQVAKQILKLRKDITFICIGDGPNFKKMKSLISKDEEKNIIFTGKVLNVEEIILAMNIGVLLSYTTPSHGEGISNSILEYMFYSKPVITSNVGGNSEIIEDKINGYLIPSQNQNAFLNTLIKLIDNPKLQENMGNKGLHKLKDFFSLNKMAQNYLELYKSV